MPFAACKVCNHIYILPVLAGRPCPDCGNELRPASRAEALQHARCPQPEVVDPYCLSWSSPPPTSSELFHRAAQAVRLAERLRRQSQEVLREARERLRSG